MDLKILLCIGLVLSKICNVNSQCQTETQTSTNDDSQYWDEEIINLEQMMTSLLDYIRLVREQIWLFDSRRGRLGPT